VIVVDDGSTDGSRATAERFAASDARVTLLPLGEHRGITAALNAGWRRASAPYVARLDADDVALPDRLARQVAFLDAHPSVAVVGGAATVVDQAGVRGSTMRLPTSSRQIAAELPRRNCIVHPAVMLRRSALEEANGYRLDHVEDYDLWLRLSERHDLANLEEPLILYRRHPAQISLYVLEEQAARALAVRAAARIRRTEGRDPLDGVTKVSPELLDRLAVDRAEVARTVEHEWFSTAAILRINGQDAEADAVTDAAVAARGANARRGIAAATFLQRAELMLHRRRRLRAGLTLLRALIASPGYTSSRVREYVQTRSRR
jgi:glycosyltransferase involved in cell wall biosynthesis